MSTVFGTTTQKYETFKTESNNGLKEANNNELKEIRETNEIFEAFKHLSSLQMAYFKQLILSEDIKIPDEEYFRLIKERYMNHTDGCPSCCSTRMVKFGKNRLKKQRYRCNSCGRVSSDSTGSPLSYSKKPIQCWLRYMECMANGMSIRESAVIVGIHRNTSFQWRHKILNALKAILKDNLSGIVEIDEVLIVESFKGNHSKDDNFYLGRKPRKRGTKPSEYYSPSKVRVLCCRDRSENILSQVAGRSKPGYLRLAGILKDRIQSGSIICTNNNMAYKALAKIMGLKLYKLKNFNEVIKKTYHNQNARFFGNELKNFLIIFNGVATKYLNFYITWLKWMHRSKDYGAGFKAMDIFLLVTSSRSKIRVGDFRNVSSMPGDTCP